MTQFDFAAFVRALAGVALFPLILLTSCLAGVSSGCSSEGRNDAFEYFKASKGKAHVTAATDGELGFFFGTKFGIKLPVTATGNIENDPFAVDPMTGQPLGMMEAAAMNANMERRLSKIEKMLSGMAPAAPSPPAKPQP